MLTNSIKKLNQLKHLSFIKPIQCNFSRLMQKKTLEGDEKQLSPTMKELESQIKEDKKSLTWRTPVGERPGDWNSKFKAFGNMEQTSDFIIAMQKDIDLSPKSIKAWWKTRKETRERYMQEFIPERLDILGPDLAAAHFLVYRQGSVKFTISPTWVKANDNDEYDLPNKYDPRYKIEAIRCDNMNLYYEGLENLRNLNELKFLSFYNVKTFDDWCLDRVSGSQFLSLEVLDISGTKCTSLGFSCLYRVPTLKLLIVDNPKQSLEYELTCAMLEEAIPKLKIIGSDEIHSNDETDKISSS